MSDVPLETLNALQAEIQGAQPAIMDETPEEQEEVETPEEGQDDVPEGFKTYEQYIEDGGDPKYYKGIEAYKQQKDILAELKEIKRKAKERDDEMHALVKWTETEKSRLRKQIEQQKKQAEEDLDIGRYKELEQEERELGLNQPQQGQEHQVVASYRQEQPFLNPASPDYDPVQAAAFAAAFNQMAVEAERRAGRPLNDAEVRQYLDKTNERLSPQKTVQQRPAKAAPSARKPVAKRPEDAMPPEIKSLYDRWSKDPRRKEAAENLLKPYGG